MRILEKSMNAARGILPKSLSVDRKPYHVAFLFKGNKLITIGTNSYKSTPRVHYFGKKFNISKYKLYSYPHAEIDAISKAWDKVYIDSNFSMVVIRMNHLYETRKSKPCADCQSIINAIGIEKVWWSEDNQTVTDGKKVYHLTEGASQ